HLAPAVPDHRSRRRQPRAHVELPERPPDAVRDCELEARNRPAGPHDPRELAKGGGGILDVAQEVRERERVELAVAEGKLVGARLDELGSAARAPPRLGEHAGALVDADDRAAVARDQCTRHEPGAGGDIEDAALRARVDPRDEEAPPPRVLAEGENRGAALVRGAERSEQRLGVHGRQSRLARWSWTRSRGPQAPTAT